MPRSHLVILCLPVLALALASWAGWRVSQPLPTESQAWTLMLPGPLPELRPFFPSDESERQILELTHPALLRLDADGEIAPSLAESWRWYGRVTLWLPDHEALRNAQTRLASVSPEQRTTWGLEEVRVEGPQTLRLKFTDPTCRDSDAALQTLADLNPQKLTLVRLQTPLQARETLEAYAKEAAHAETIKRLWFDDDGTCELVTTLTSLQAQTQLTDWLLPRLRPLPSIQPLDELVALSESVLEMKLDPLRAVWPTGKAITAEDLHATLAYARTLPLSRTLQEGLRPLQDITETQAGTLEFSYRRNYGAAFMAWVELPILSAEWLNAQGTETRGFPPGAGSWQVIRRRSDLLTLGRPNQATLGETEVPSKLHLSPAAELFPTRLRLATGRLDGLWPVSAESALEEGLSLHHTPARNRLLLLWNTRSARAELPVRRALAQAVDRTALVQSALKGRGQPLQGLFPPGLWFTPQEPLPKRADLQAAQDLLTAAGWQKDVTGQVKKAGRPLNLELLVTQGNEQRQQLAQTLVAQWAPLGVQVTVTPVPAENLVSERLSLGRFDAVLLGLNEELTWDQTALWHSTLNRGHLNFSGLTDPQLDVLLEALATEFDLSAIPQRARAVEERVLEAQAVVPLLSDLQPLALKPDLAKNLPPGDKARGVTLHDLLNPPPALQLRLPDE